MYALDHILPGSKYCRMVSAEKAAGPSGDPSDSPSDDNKARRHLRLLANFDSAPLSLSLSPFAQSFRSLLCPSSPESGPRRLDFLFISKESTDPPVPRSVGLATSHSLCVLLRGNPLAGDQIRLETSSSPRLF